MAGQPLRWRLVTNALIWFQFRLNIDLRTWASIRRKGRARSWRTRPSCQMVVAKTSVRLLVFPELAWTKQETNPVPFATRAS